jgi:hypothetical protein
VTSPPLSEHHFSLCTTFTSATTRKKLHTSIMQPPQSVHLPVCAPAQPVNKAFYHYNHTEKVRTHLYQRYHSTIRIVECIKQQQLARSSFCSSGVGYPSAERNREARSKSRAHASQRPPHSRENLLVSLFRCWSIGETLGTRSRREGSFLLILIVSNTCREGQLLLLVTSLFLLPWFRVN